MKINKVVAINPHTKEKEVFTFSTAADGKPIITTCGERLYNYLEFCFSEETECPCDVEIELLINSVQFSLSSSRNEEGVARSVLKRMEDGRYQVVTRTRTREYLEQLVGAPLAYILKLGYVNDKTVCDFHGNLKLFNEIRLLSDTQNSIAKSSADIKAMKDNALNKELDAVVRDVTIAVTQLGELKAKQNSDTIRADITKQLDDTQSKYNKLIARHNDIEAARVKVKLRDDVELLIPKIKTLRILMEQRAEQEKKRHSITGELEWQENELVAINKQLAEKDRQYALLQDKRSRAEAINNEFDYLDQTIANIRYELIEVGSERQILIDSKQTIEKEIFEKRLELEKTQWLCETKSYEYDELYNALRLEFNVKGLDVNKIASLDLDSSVDDLRKLVTDFDTMRASLSGKIENLSAILENSPTPTVSDVEIAEKEQEIAMLAKRQRELEQQRGEQFNIYTRNLNKIVTSLIRDKIQSILRAATQYLNAFTDGGYSLVEDNYVLSVLFDDELMDYDDLSDTIKAAVYVSVLLSIFGADDSDYKWLIFDERVALDKKKLANVLRSVYNLCYVVDFAIEQ